MSSRSAPRTTISPIPAISSTAEAATAANCLETKSILVSPTRLNILKCVTSRLRSSRSHTSRPAYRAVNTLVRMPMMRVTANPRTWSVPIRNRINAVMKVVTLASTMVVNALAKPLRMLILRLEPRACSSRMRSKISTLASTAMPIVSTMPASPGRVKVASMRLITPITSTMFSTRHRSATSPSTR